ncbi:MAG: hypothetical protein K0S09_2911 [Sphingobacteriaceae bacterium]|jgi:hypothetical protein|nr:hypothetical protein [Sphingobacteriaceae bacterium]
MKIHIVLYPELNPWILTKIATKLMENIQALGHEATIGHGVDRSADINHHITYLQYKPLQGGVHSIMITHIDNSVKLQKVKTDLHSAGVGICMSKNTLSELVKLGVPRLKLQYAHMAKDGNAVSRKICIGFTTRIYADGRKREDYFTRILKIISPADFKFEIMGFGWGPTIEKMRAAGFEVRYFEEFAYDDYMNLMSRLDYYVYLGADEGSAGFIDALAAGVKTIVQPQGFHLDAPNGITHSFETFDQLKGIFLQIAAERNRLVSAVSEWTWENYAKKHIAIWDSCLNNNLGSLEAELNAVQASSNNSVFLTKLLLFKNLVKHRATLVWNLRKRRSYPGGSRLYGPGKGNK